MWERERKNSKFETMNVKGLRKSLGWKGFGFGLYYGINCIRSRLYVNIGLGFILYLLGFYNW